MNTRWTALLFVLAAGCADTGYTTFRPMDPCAGVDDGVACTSPRGGVAGQCMWLTARERDRLDIRTNTDCRVEGKHAGSCHTCTTEADRKAISADAVVNDPKGAYKY